MKGNSFFFRMDSIPPFQSRLPSHRLHMVPGFIKAKNNSGAAISLASAWTAGKLFPRSWKKS